MRSILQLRVKRENASWSSIIFHYCVKDISACVYCGFSRETEGECGEREGTKITFGSIIAPFSGLLSS